MTVFDTILIANRGEIACRIIRTARRMGLRTVAVYSEVDAQALHVQEADMAFAIGAAPARASYLNVAALLQAAAAAQSQGGGSVAIHPGYGFLSENAAFAEACTEAGFIFIGPPAAAMRAMGGKSEAKALMEQTGVPLVPGYHGTEQGEDFLAQKAAAIGFPVLIKASAGGGGKGMKVADGPADFAAALASAKREAQAAFGDDRVLVEKYLARPRHVEIQIFADARGNGVYLFERDCSVQRRHQKVIEEAPAPDMDPNVRARMGEAAVAAAKAIGYVGAGTVEFLLDHDGSFYFMEMNTRLQVEHPVTEKIIGQDLVEWQIRVARGEALPLDQEALRIHGHAIEVRIYAEDPAKGFLPQTGRLAHLSFPKEDAHVRVDAGVRTGDVISIHYDPMIAKLIAWDEDRPAALRRMRAALAATHVAGLNANVSFLARLIRLPAFQAGDLDTRFIDRHQEALAETTPVPTPTILALASLYSALTRKGIGEMRGHAAAAWDDPWSAMAASQGGWQMGLPATEVFLWQGVGAGVGEGERLEVRLLTQPDGTRTIETAGAVIQVRGAHLAADGILSVELDGCRTTARIIADRGGLSLFYDGAALLLLPFDPYAASATEEASHGRLTAPMPGKIIAVLVAAGDVVEKGQALIVLEAMKMEHTLKAPAAGCIAAVRCRTGDQTPEGMELIAFE
jgi:3-methylcrotonyl-CoA carboxylase alpha subunit